MAILYKVDLKSLKLLEAQYTKDRLELYNILSIKSYQQLHESDLNIIKYQYPSHDVYQNVSGYVDSEFHSHSDKEIRIILKGTAYFYIPVENYLYIAACSELDELILYENIPHWFSTNTELLALRFFDNNTSYICNFINDISPDIQNAISHFKKNRLLFNI